MFPEIPLPEAYRNYWHVNDSECVICSRNPSACDINGFVIKCSSRMFICSSWSFLSTRGWTAYRNFDVYMEIHLDKSFKAPSGCGPEGERSQADGNRSEFISFGRRQLSPDRQKRACILCLLFSVVLGALKANKCVYMLKTSFGAASHGEHKRAMLANLSLIAHVLANLSACLLACPSAQK